MNLNMPNFGMGLQLRVTTFLIPLYWRKINDGGGGVLNCIGPYFYLWIKPHVKYGKMAPSFILL